jgi:hypothetical protein
MTRIRIDYSDLLDSASWAKKSSDRLEEYADEINREVGSKINNLTRGASGNTNSIFDLANRKVNDLRSQASRYRSYEDRLKKFVENAKSADERVEMNIEKIRKEDYKGLSLFQKITATFYGLYQKTLGRTAFGRAMDTITRLRVDKLLVIQTGLKKAKDFFKYGKGRYIINIVSAVGTVIGAIATLANPITGPLAAVAALASVAAAVSLVVKLGSSGVTIADNIRALFMESDDPGAARYYGNTNSIESFTKKHVHSKKWQNIAQIVDFAGTTADVVRSGLDLFTNSHTMQVLNPDGSISKLTVGVQDFSWDTLKGNLLSNIGFSTNVVKDAGGNLVRDGFGNIKTRTTFSTASLLKKIAGWKKTGGTVTTLNNITNVISNTTLPVREINKINDLRFSTRGFIKGELRTLLKHIPIVKDYVDFGYDGYSLATS